MAAGCHTHGVERVQPRYLVRHQDPTSAILDGRFAECTEKEEKIANPHTLRVEVALGARALAENRNHPGMRGCMGALRSGSRCASVPGARGCNSLFSR